MIKHYPFLNPFLIFSSSLFALTTLTVTTSTDDDAGGFGNTGDLRYCINTMNTLLNSVPDDFAIVFDTPMTIQLNGILPLINNSTNPVNITIGNSGSIPTVTIDGNSGSFPGFFTPTGNVTIQNMIFQNLTAKGGNGGDGISGGGGAMGAGGALYIPATFLNGSSPSITLMNVNINECSAIGGNGGNYLTSFSTGDEGGGGGGGFSGNGGSIVATGSTGGAGGGGFGGDGGNVNLSTSDFGGGGGGGGGGLGSRTLSSSPTNLGTGGSDDGFGLDGNGYGLAITGGPGAGGYNGGNLAGGGGGGDITGGSPNAGGGGGGSYGANGNVPEGSIPPGGSSVPSGGNGGDGGGGGGGGVVITSFTNGVNGQAGNGGYGGGGGGGSGTGASDASYTVAGGSGGTGGGGGGGGVNQSGSTPADGGNSQGGGGGGGGGPSNGSGGTDIGNLGGGAGGLGANATGSGFGGGGGGSGSGLGGAIFVDSGLNLTIQAFSGIPTVFNTSNNTVQAGTPGSAGAGGGTDGGNGSALGNSIFLRSNSSLSFIAANSDDLLTLGDQVSFVDDTSFGMGGTAVRVSGDGTVVYNGTTDYEGSITINNANFKVNGTINNATINVCRNVSQSEQRGTLSGSGIITGNVFVNSGVISPDPGEILSLGNLTLSSASGGSIGSLCHLDIDSNGTSLISVTGPATLAGILQIELETDAIPGTYTLLTSTGITGTFDSIELLGDTPDYTLSYFPEGAPTFVQFAFSFPPPPPPPPTPSHPSLSTQNLYGNKLKIANYLNILSPEANQLGLQNQYELLNDLSSSQYNKALKSISPTRNSSSIFASQNVMFMFSESLDFYFTKLRLAQKNKINRSTKETALLAENELLAAYQSPRKTMYTPSKNADMQIWAMGFGEFSHQDSQDQTPAFDFNSGGFFVAYDYGNSNEGCIGALAGYANSAIDEQNSSGSSDLNAGFLSIYGMKFFSNYFLDAAIWGQYLSVDQKRNISFPGFNETAKSSYHAEQLDLHFGTGYDFNINTGTIEPFALIDWVYEWDPSYKEKGAAPYNMEISSKNSWMLRSETGLNGYNTSFFSWGTLIAQVKLSYVYKKPHNIGHMHASIFNAPASFTVDAFTSDQNLISPAAELFWQTNWNGYASISYNGEFGSGYRSNQFYAKFGYSF